ncbi:MAG: hypothetical protein J7L19_04110 [Dehalococcoidia bacterium]|nr:hypothetical protein [Dehalococcoidia bacterium]
MLDYKTFISNNYYHQNFQGNTVAILAYRSIVKEINDKPEASVEQNIVYIEVSLPEFLAKASKDKLKKEVYK